MPKSCQWSYSKACPGAGSYYQKAAEKTVNNQTKEGHYFDKIKKYTSLHADSTSRRYTVRIIQPGLI